MKKKFKCPTCKKIVEEYPALSRKDNKTDICSQCGVNEALEIIKNYPKYFGEI